MLIKRLFYIFVSAALCLTFCVGGFHAHAEGEIKNIVLLGDSITSGYGLSDGENDFGYYLGEYYGAGVENYAKVGLKTQGLIERLSDSDVRSSVENADLVCISIGGNDLLLILEEAAVESGISEGFGRDSTLGITDLTPGFIQSFIEKYAPRFEPAAEEAGKNIKTIIDDILDINPDCRVCVQTVYQPLETENSAVNLVMSPMRKFSSEYIGMINEDIRKYCSDTADINLKFSEKPYLYTNIDNYDVHPNAVGHFLIAEEIIETIGLQGNMKALQDEIDSLPYGVFSEFPEYLRSELNELSNGELRRGSLEQVIERADVKREEEEEASRASAETSEGTQESSTVSEKAAENKEPQDSGTKKKLSRVFMIIGFSLIIAVTFMKIIRRRRKK